MMRAVAAFILAVAVASLVAACGDDRTETQVAIDPAVLAQPHHPGEMLGLGAGVTLEVQSAEISETLARGDGGIGSGDPFAILMLLKLRFENESNQLMHGPTFHTSCGDYAPREHTSNRLEYDPKKPIANGTTESYVVLDYPKWCSVEGKLIGKFADGRELTWVIPVRP